MSSVDPILLLGSPERYHKVSNKRFENTDGFCVVPHSCRGTLFFLWCTAVLEIGSSHFAQTHVDLFHTCPLWSGRLA